MLSSRSGPLLSRPPALDRRDLRVGLLLALATFFLLLLVFEAGFRFRAHLLNRGILSEAIDPPVDPPADGAAELGHLIQLSENRRIIYELKPNLAVEYEGARVTLDRRGFRGPDRPLRPDEGVSRIVGIGDSFMFGLGVADDETYLALLEEALNRAAPGRAAPGQAAPGQAAPGEAAAGPSPRRWQVINTAVPGYNTVMEVETLRHKGLRYSPDLVIIEFVGNDLSLPNFIRAKEPIFAVDRSFLVDFFVKRRERNRGRPMGRRLAQFGLVGAPEKTYGVFYDDPEKVPPEYRNHVGWDSYVAALRELRQMSQEHGFPVVWATISADRAQRRVKVLARRLGFHVLDIGRAFRRYLAEEGFDAYLGSPLARSATDGHPSALGHRIAAETIHEFLRQKKLVG